MKLTFYEDLTSASLHEGLFLVSVIITMFFFWSAMSLIVTINLLSCNWHIYCIAIGAKIRLACLMPTAQLFNDRIFAIWPLYKNLHESIVL